MQCPERAQGLRLVGHGWRKLSELAAALRPRNQGMETSMANHDLVTDKSYTKDDWSVLREHNYTSSSAGEFGIMPT